MILIHRPAHILEFAFILPAFLPLPGKEILRRAFGAAGILLHEISAGGFPFPAGMTGRQPGTEQNSCQNQIPKDHFPHDGIPFKHDESAQWSDRLPARLRLESEQIHPLG